jgi:uncharacterized protein
LKSLKGELSTGAGLILILPLIFPGGNAQKGDVKMKELIMNIGQALVDNPEHVAVVEISGEHSIIYELKVAKTDIGKIIGKQGRTAEAIRTIVQAASGKLKKRITLAILE